MLKHDARLRSGHRERGRHHGRATANTHALALALAFARRYECAIVPARNAPNAQNRAIGRPAPRYATLNPAMHDSPDDYRHGLATFFLRSAHQYAERPAIEVGTQRLTYASLAALAGRFGAAILEGTAGRPPVVGVLASRSVELYAGLLGTLLCGGTIVPLNPSFPASRTRQMLELAGANTLVVDNSGAASLPALLAGVPRSLHVVAPDLELNALREACPGLSIAAPASRTCEPAHVPPDDVAVIFFTSGSTGTPKGVGVLHRNVVRFIEMSRERYRDLPLGPTDRFSQFYDVTFDSSMFDLYVGWAVGACLCCPTTTEWVNPNRFIEARALTVIDIVPSTGHAMNRRGAWRPGRFPNLKLCRFGGEALPAELAQTLADAAPNAAIDNVYGPTECTVDAAYYRWDATRSPTECTHGVVPIGIAGPMVGLRVVDTYLADVPIGHEGELLITGPQVTPGYWRDAARTAASFISLDGIVHYRTGDLVRRVPDGAPIPYLGRMDQQIKISGVRIELGEVEAAIAEAAATTRVVALGWPRTASGASGIVAFIAGSPHDESTIRRLLRDRLPTVMLPRELFLLDDELPVNVNGKVDRMALMGRLERNVPSPR